MLVTSWKVVARSYRVLSQKLTLLKLDPTLNAARPCLGSRLLFHDAVRTRSFCAITVRPTLERLHETLLSHPAVSHCELVSDVAYVITDKSSSSGSLISGKVEEWELQEYIAMKVGVRRDAVPEVRFVDYLPGSEYQHVPFTLIHMLHALFTEIADDDDDDRCFTISLQEFTAFCSKTGLFENGDRDAVEIFLSARSSKSTSELLFEDNDGFGFELPKTDTNRIKFYEFQKLMVDSGTVEINARDGSSVEPALAAFFIDENVVDIVLQHWFAAYDSTQDGYLDFRDYVSLVSDFQLPTMVTAEAFRQLSADTHANGIDITGFRTVLEQANVLKTGASVVKDDEMGKTWRAIEDSQAFLQPTRVFVADGREGASPARMPNSLRFVCISDTHGLHREMTWRIPAGDVLLHAGDFSMVGELEEVQDFAQWMRSLPFNHKVVIAGNHDLTLDGNYEGPHLGKETNSAMVRDAFEAAFKEDASLHYLEDQEYSIQGIRIYGTPWQPEFNQWAFNLPRGSAIAEKWKAIPDGIDILLVHGPPLGRGDTCVPSLVRTGCADLLEQVQTRVQPAFCVYGHVHEGAGVTFDGVTHFINASCVTENYDCVHAPFVFDVPL